MIYLGHKKEALAAYSKEVMCWLGIKLRGRWSTGNPSGYNCDVNSSNPLLKGKKRSGLDPDFCSLFTDTIIEEVICGKPHALLATKIALEEAYLQMEGKTMATFNDNCKKVFVDSGYTGWFLKEKKNYQLATLLDQHTCTFCNREYIFTYKNEDGGKGMVPQFDHWFPKNEFPLFGLSFYNLIPSCATCNTIKSTTKLNLDQHLHPYEDELISSSYVFSYEPVDLDSNEIVFQNNSENEKGIETVNALKLPTIYKGHADKELKDLLDLKYKYSRNYLKILLDETFSSLEINEQERYRLIFGIELDEKHYHKKILSKFKADIIQQLLSMESK